MGVFEFGGFTAEAQRTQRFAEKDKLLFEFLCLYSAALCALCASAVNDCVFKTQTNQ
jgi:hypothetical protein